MFSRGILEPPRCVTGSAESFLIAYETAHLFLLGFSCGGRTSLDIKVMNRSDGKANEI
jgi:hypothetical protein